MIGRLISMSVRDTTVLNFAKHQLFRIPCRPHDISILLDKETGLIKFQEFTLHGSGTVSQREPTPLRGGVDALIGSEPTQPPSLRSGHATKIESKSRDGDTSKSGNNSSFCEVE
jgi:hypothetical protein